MAYTLTYRYGNGISDVSRTDVRGPFDTADELHAWLTHNEQLTAVERITLFMARELTIRTPGFAAEHYTLTEV